MTDVYGDNFYCDAPSQSDTLSNLGPLRALAGCWEGAKGADQHPVAAGVAHDVFVERYELVPIDAQTNGPQLFYGLRYHTHILNPNEAATFHDQVGYWLWEPAAGAVTLTLGIPRGQVLLASGPADADATSFELTATAGSASHGILSNPFLNRAFRTLSYRVQVTVNGDGTWSYEEEGMLDLPGSDEPFRHIDSNTLSRVAAPVPNPLAQLHATDTSLGIGSLRNESENLR